ncbi:MAG: hypothetical protein K6E54_04165 [Bacteroidaceae bacterium]|nr:hypothetical protein [Bacteroidaceae bacterium]
MKLKNIAYTLVTGAALSLTACSPDDYSLGAVDYDSADLVEGVAFTATKDATNPNIVHLKSLLPTSYNALWQHPQGRDQGPELDLKIPFAGTYAYRYGVQTRGGVVYGDTCYFTIDDFCADFVSDQLWEYLSGGVGKSKKWFLDLDANGVSRYFAGPLYFKGTNDSWLSITEGVDVGGDTWAWDADWNSVAGWAFTSEAKDFGYMEFDLKDGSNVTVVENDLGKTMKGTYMLDTDNHTLQFTDAELLHESVYDAAIESWTGTLKLLSLTENTMQVGVYRASERCLICYNFISEDYYNNWSPTVVDTDVTPTLREDWRDYVEQKTNKVITYKLSSDLAYDWCGLDGKAKGITSTSIDGIEDLTLVLNSATKAYSVTTPAGNTVEGVYSLSDDGVFTFDNGLPLVQLSADGAVSFKTNYDKTLRILGFDVDDYSGNLANLWLGLQDVDDMGRVYQYVGFQFVPQIAGDNAVKYTASLNYFDTDWVFSNSENVFITGDGDYTFSISAGSGADGQKPYGIYLDVLKVLKKSPNVDITIKSIKVDGVEMLGQKNMTDENIVRCLGDVNTTARRYILNPWGDFTSWTDMFKFKTSIDVVVSVVMDSGEVKFKGE